MARLAPRALRSLRSLAEAAAAGRAARIRFHDTERVVADRTVDVLGLAFDAPRWLVAAWSRELRSLRLIDLRRISRVRMSRRRAEPAPAGFDPLDFALHRVLDPGAGPPAQVTVWVDERLATAAPALLPGSTPVATTAGCLSCQVRTNRPDIVGALVASLAPWAGVHSPWVMPPATSRPARAEDTAESRRLRLAAWLLSQREPVTRAQVYAAFPDDYRGKPEAAEKKFTRDKDALRELGFAIAKVELGRRDDQVGYVLDARSCSIPAIEFTPDEAALVWTAGVGALRFSDHPLRDELESAVRKLMLGAKGLPPRAAAPEELADGGGPAAEKALQKLIEAWERRKRVTIQYWRVATGEVVERAVDVYGWASRRGEWIFVGYCHLRGAVRIFYLSRVRALKVNGVRAQDPDYDVPVDFDIRRWSRQQIWDYDVHPPRPAAVRFRGSLARIARQLLPAATFTTDDTGARVARLEVRNLRGLVRQALAWGPDAELTEPAEGRAMAREILGVLAGRSGGGSP